MTTNTLTTTVCTAATRSQSADREVLPLSGGAQPDAVFFLGQCVRVGGQRRQRLPRPQSTLTVPSITPTNTLDQPRSPTSRCRPWPWATLTATTRGAAGRLRIAGQAGGTGNHYSTLYTIGYQPKGDNSGYEFRHSETNGWFISKQSGAYVCRPTSTMTATAPWCAMWAWSVSGRTTTCWPCWRPCPTLRSWETIWARGPHGLRQKQLSSRERAAARATAPEHYRDGGVRGRGRNSGAGFETTIEKTTSPGPPMSAAPLNTESTMKTIPERTQWWCTVFPYWSIPTEIFPTARYGGHEDPATPHQYHLCGGIQ